MLESPDIRAMTDLYDLSFYFVFDWHRDADWNFHQYKIPAVTFWHVFSGRRRVIVDGTPYAVEPGCIAVLPVQATVTTDHGGREPGPIHYLSMGLHAYIGGVEWSGLYGAPVVLNVPMSPEREEWIRIWKELVEGEEQLKQASAGHPDFPLSARHTALALAWESGLKRWLSLLTRITLPRLTQPEPVSDPRVRDICAYIRGHYPQPIRSADLARRACMSEGHMRAVFRDVMGMSPQQYVANVRMEKAKELLVASSLSLSEIADRIGYNDLSYFISAFRKREGMTPSFYRKRIYWS